MKVTKLRGEYAYRMEKNFSRLQDREYTPEEVFRRSDNNYDWPGDWEGRLLLALALHRRETGAQPRYLEQIIDGVWLRMQAHGFLGEDWLSRGLVNEQQLAGHSWLLRGLMTCGEILEDPRIPEMVQSIVQRLYLPTQGMYRRYPLGDCRDYSGRAMGSTQREPVNGWLLSTDIGCCFIALDAVSEYYLHTGDGRILPLAQEMAEAFMGIDYMAASLQTHASLSATRGVLRLYQTTKEPRYAAFAETFLEYYIQNGMTENYANYNWFARPTWTEPCAIVDSYLLAMELYRLTGKAALVELANRIFYNGLETAQRSNGGFGCDRCVVPGGEQEELYTWEEYYEAFWCCTMRGAEGLCYALSGAFLPGAEGGAFVNYIPGDYQTGELEFSVDTDFPYGGTVTVRIIRCPENTVLDFWLPRNCETEQVQVQLDGRSLPLTRTELGAAVTVGAPGALTLEIPLKNCLEPTLHSGLGRRRSCWHGILMLGCDGESDFSLDFFPDWEYNKSGCLPAEQRLYPLNRGIFLSREEILARRTKLLF